MTTNDAACILKIYMMSCGPAAIASVVATQATSTKEGRYKRLPCFSQPGDACEETVMHVKTHDQVFNALEPLPYSLFFPVELHFILQSLYDKLRLSTDL